MLHRAHSDSLDRVSGRHIDLGDRAERPREDDEASEEDPGEEGRGPVVDLRDGVEREQHVHVLRADLRRCRWTQGRAAGPGLSVSGDRAIRLGSGGGESRGELRGRNRS